MFRFKLITLYFSVVISVYDCAKILAYYPAPSISHQVVFRPITLELIKRGHEVTVVTTDPMFSKDNAPENLKEIDVHDISYNILSKQLRELVTGQSNVQISQISKGAKLIPAMIENQLRTKEFQELISNKTKSFDLILLEAFMPQVLGVTHRFKAPVILISSFGAIFDNYDIVGAPSHPLLYHKSLRQRLYNLTMWEKVNEVYTEFQLERIYKSIDDKTDKILKDVFGEATPPLSVLKNNVDMLFLNINPVWEGNRPVPPNVIYMGGLHQTPAKKLPNHLQNFLDASDKGLIYFSFGTNVQPSILPEEKILIFKNVFAKLPFNVIWKWDNDTLSGISHNVKSYKWLPQADILRHPNVKLFITQGGLQSTDEAITAGVPLIGIPMLGDQWYNVEKYVHHGIGVKLDLDNLTEDQLRNAIFEVIENKRYRDNIVRLQSLMQDQPQQPLERAVWWIEYVLRHGGAKHLRSPAANMSWREYLELELLGVILLSFIVITLLVIYIIRFLIYRVILNVIPTKKLKKL